MVSSRYGLYTWHNKMVFFRSVERIVPLGCKSVKMSIHQWLKMLQVICGFMISEANGKSFDLLAARCFRIKVWFMNERNQWDLYQQDCHTHEPEVLYCSNLAHSWDTVNVKITVRSVLLLFNVNIWTLRIDNGWLANVSFTLHV